MNHTEHINQELESLIELMYGDSGVIVLLSKSLKIVDINGKGLVSLGLNSKAEALKRNFTDFLGSKSQKKFDIFLKRIQDQNTANEVQSLQTSTSDLRWMEVYGVLNHSNENAEYLLVYIDIDERVRLREERLEQKERLIEEERLSALKQFSGNVAHEINNPLTIIKTQLSLISRHLEEPDQKNKKEDLKARLEQVQETCNRISGVINTLNKISSQRDVNSPMRLESLSKIIDLSLSICREQLHQKGIDIENQVDESIKVYCREIGLSQVILNLINNSKDAIQSLKEKFIRLETETVNNKVRLIITDSGKGINQDIARKIMEPFFTTKEFGEGSGLGLSIASSIMEGFGGRLYYNPSNKNTQFIIEFKKISSEK